MLKTVDCQWLETTGVKSGNGLPTHPAFQTRGSLIWGEKSTYCSPSTRSRKAWIRRRREWTISCTSSSKVYRAIDRNSALSQTFGAMDQYKHGFYRQMILDYEDQR